jgi:predicted nucleotidyltransferase
MKVLTQRQFRRIRGLRMEILKRTQNLTHRALNNFLGFWPWGIQTSPEALEQIQKYLHSNNGIRSDFVDTLNWFNRGNPRDDKSLADFFVRFYQDFHRITHQLPNQGSSLIPDSPLFRLRHYQKDQRPYLGPLLDLQAELKAAPGKITSAHLFGSYATADFIPGWSDVDMLLILSHSSIQDSDHLLATKNLVHQLQRHLFTIDPLQLHGFFILTQVDFEWYPQHYFPLLLFEHAVSLYKSYTTYEIIERDDKRERVNTFLQQADYFNNLSNSGVIPHTYIERKLFFHKIFSFPLYFLQALDIHCYKKDSFDICKANYPQFKWEVIDQPSHWMRTRPYATNLEKSLRQLSGMHPRLGARMLESRAYRWMHRYREPFWQVGESQMKSLIQEISQLSLACKTFVRESFTITSGYAIS